MGTGFESLARQAIKPLWGVVPPRVQAMLVSLRYRAWIFWRLLMRRGSPFVSGYPQGLRGVEIGAAAHNRFYLNAINVDRYAGLDTPYKRAERLLALRAVPVDVVAPGDALPFPNESFDFVFASHVIEHFPDPIRALRASG